MQEVKKEKATVVQEPAKRSTTSSGGVAELRSRISKAMMNPPTHPPPGTVLMSTIADCTCRALCRRFFLFSACKSVRQ